MRRSVIIHVRRYGLGNADQDDFRNTIYSFQLNMPLPQTPDLVKHCDYLYERTAGCVGILRDWLAEAYSQVLDEPKASTLRLHHLEENVPFSSERASKMFNRITKDEEDFLQEFSDETRGFSVKNSRDETTLNEEPIPTHNRKRHRAGERNPTRDENGRSKRNAA